MSGVIRLGVNIDHVATLRQARGTRYPDPLQAALLAIQGGADGITVHLREDRRHIQDRDVRLLLEVLQVPLNLEMAASPEMVALACQLKPAYCCLVPEKREELTTEGGLNVVGEQKKIAQACEALANAGIEVSLFVDPFPAQISAAKKCGAAIVELHTGAYAEAKNKANHAKELERIEEAAFFADDLDLIVNAGHGLHYHNTQSIAEITVFNELNIGHSIVSESVMVGMESAVRRMKSLMLNARHNALQDAVAIGVTSMVLEE